MRVTKMTVYGTLLISTQIEKNTIQIQFLKVKSHLCYCKKTTSPSSWGLVVVKFVIGSEMSLHIQAVDDS